MILPAQARLLLNCNKVFLIVKIHFETEQVTLQERENVYNTVDFKDVEFLFDDDVSVDSYKQFNGTMGRKAQAFLHSFVSKAAKAWE